MDNPKEWLALGVFVVVGVLIWVSYRLMRTSMRDASDYDDDFCDRCEKCATDLRRTDSVCTDCGTRNERFFVRQMLSRLNSEWPEEPRDPVEPRPTERRVKVHETSDQREMDLWVEQFSARGIWCDVIDSEPFLEGARSVPAGAYQHLFVRDADAARARKLVAFFRDGKSIGMNAM